MEMGTDENANLVSTVFERALNELRQGREISEQDNHVYQIETLSQEINSGASFEQYFRWMTKYEIDNIIDHINRLNIPQVYLIVDEAIKVAFPNGIPEDEDEYNKCTDWSKGQEQQLHDLCKQFENYNGTILNKLGQFIKANQLT